MMLYESIPTDRLPLSPMSEAAHQQGVLAPSPAMKVATDWELDKLQDTMEYHFTDTKYLKDALVAPGAVEENYDGHRKSAQLGEFLIQFIVLSNALRRGVSRSEANDELRFVAARKQLATVAKIWKFDKLITWNPRQAGRPPSDNTLAATVSAIVGASWFDSGEVDKASTIIRALGIDAKECIIPEMVVLEESTFLNDIISEDSPDGSSDITTPSVTDRSTPATTEIQESIVDGPITQSAMGQNYSEENVPLKQLMSNPVRTDGEPAEMVHVATPTVQSRIEDGASVNESSPSSIFDHELREGVRCEGNSYPQLSISGSQVYSLDVFGDVSIWGSYPFHLEAPIDEFQNTGINGFHESLSGREALPCRTETSSVAGIEHSYSRKRQNTVPTTRSPKRRRVTESLPCDPKDALLTQNVDLEKERCRISGMPCPDQLFTSELDKRPKLSRCNAEQVRSLKAFFFAIGSSESVAGFLAIAQAHRRSLAGAQLPPAGNITPAQRLEEIERLGGDTAYKSFLRRCHMHRLYLYLESSMSAQKTIDGFVNITVQSLSLHEKPKKGNPRNIADAELTKSILLKVYPQLQIDNPDYQKKYDIVSKQRKLARRLNLLVDKFGYGIIGLLPLPSEGSAIDPSLSITDKFLLDILDRDFKEFVEFIHQLQGAHLRRLGDALSEMAQSIFEGTMDGSKRFGLESLEQEDILTYPKGSEKLLELVSRTMELSPFSNGAS